MFKTLCQLRLTAPCARPADSTAYGELESINEQGIFTQQTGEMATWIGDAVDIWENGLGTRVPPTLTQDQYNDVLVKAGLERDSRQRRDFLREWLALETPIHWGDNLPNHYQMTPFRMVEGGADENGSLSFSQVLYTYRFGGRPCAAHHEANLNLYHPRGNLKTMVIHSASDNGSATSRAPVEGVTPAGCEGGLHMAFVDNDLRVAYGTTVLAGGANPMASFVGYLDNRSGALVTDTEEDVYEALAKAIAIYNGSARLFTTNSWPSILRYRRYDPNSSHNTEEVCHSCRYSVTAMNAVTVMQGHLRRYVWRPTVSNPADGLGVDLNGDGAIADVPGHPETTTPWCFVYGELEWVTPFTFEDDEGHPIRANRGGSMEYRDAKNVVLSFINDRYESEGDELVILDDDVVEIDVGWVFCYNSKRFLETRELVHALAGNAPVLFDNRDETLHVMGTAKPLDDYIKEHLATYSPKSKNR